MVSRVSLFPQVVQKQKIDQVEIENIFLKQNILATTLPKIVTIEQCLIKLFSAADGQISDYLL